VGDGERVEQLTLDDGLTGPSTADRRAAEVAADRLRDRFGHEVVRPARLVGETE